MLSAYDTNLSTSFGNFYQSDLTGIGSGDGDGSWKPGFSFDIPGNANSAIDSFLTIGGGVGSEAVNNLTTPDPNLGQGTNPDIFNEDIGWYLNPPTSSQGDALGTEYEVWIGRFVVTGDQARGGASFSIDGTISYNYGSNTGLYSGGIDGDFVFTPAPGALALMGLGGMYGRRRRA